MPRSVRLEYEGALYHVMCRGDRREPIFEDDRDREVFLETLGEACGRSGAEVYSYVLMTNHYHLLLGTPHGNLVAAMRWFQSSYTARFNARHRQRGHVFQDRYKAIPVEREEMGYGRAISDYIHLNPVRAGLLNPEERPLGSYRWSSLSMIAGPVPAPGWLRGEQVLSWHGWTGERAAAGQEYAAMIERRARECWQERRERADQVAREGGGVTPASSVGGRGWFVGGGEFREKLETIATAAVEGKRRESFERGALGRHDEVTAEKLLEETLRRLDVSETELRVMRKNDPLKQQVTALLKRNTTVSDSWLCQRLDMGHRSNVSRAVAKMRRSDCSL